MSSTILRQAARSRSRRSGRIRPSGDSTAGTTTVAGHTSAVVDYFALASAAESALRGLELCARRTRVSTISIATMNAASGLRALVHAILEAAAAPSLREPRFRTGKVSERLRWEWLASTAVVLDGPRGVEHRLLEECARILSDALPHTRGRAVEPAIAARFRVASAEAYSLAQTAPRESSDASAATDPLPLPAPAPAPI